MRDYLSILGWALVGCGLLAILVEPLVIGRIAASNPRLRARKRLIVGAIVISNLLFIAFGIAVILYGDRWLGA